MNQSDKCTSKSEESSAARVRVFVGVQQDQLSQTVSVWPGENIDACHFGL